MGAQHTPSLWAHSTPPQYGRTAQTPLWAHSTPPHYGRTEQALRYGRTAHPPIMGAQNTPAGLGNLELVGPEHPHPPAR